MLAKNILQIDIPFVEVLKLLIFALPSIISLSIPFATLVSCLMSVGGLSTHNEFLAMRTIGISFVKTFLPYVFLGLFTMGLTFLSIEVLQPWGSIQFSRQYQRILSLNPQLSLSNSSITQYQDDIIAVKSVSGNTIEGLVIIDKDSDDNSRTIVAKSAQVQGSDKGVISLALFDVVSISDEEKPKEYNYMLGKKMIYNVLLKDITLDVQSLNVDNKSLTDINAYIAEQKDAVGIPQERDRGDEIQGIKNILSGEYDKYAAVYGRENKTRVFNSYVESFMRRMENLQGNIFFSREIHFYEVVLFKKLAFPFAVLLFVFIAFPVGLFYKRSGKSIGFGVGLVISFAYWFFIIFFQSIVLTTPTLSPFIMMWIPNFVIFLLGLVLLFIKRNI